MAVTQYIGSRYVPLFADPIEWDTTKSYEPLTIVYYQGNSYTSKQAVPAGVEITNDTYWAITGNYNAQIEQYRQEVRTFDSRITQNTTNITANTTAISNEETARETADSAETTARKDADASLAADISAEKTARIAGDNALTAEISRVETSLTGDISDEETARIAADNALDAKFQGLIDDEKSARIAADNELSIKLNDRINEVADSIDRNFVGKYIAPIYIGDFIENRQHGACCRAADRIYTFSPDNYENNGVVRVFDLTTNSQVYVNNSVPMGHGNSAAYDSVRNRFWIAPIYSYASGTATPFNGLYWYDSTFTTSHVENMPRDVFFVTFDPITKDLYTGYVDSTNLFTIYRMREDESTFTLFREIPGSYFEYTGSTGAWQDAAIYDSVFYLVKPEGSMYVFDIRNETPKMIDTYRIGAYDAQGTWRYGEVEGIEFSEGGHLYNARNGTVGVKKTGYHMDVNCCFVTELNTKSKCTPAVSHVQTPHGSYTISAQTQAKFALGRGELRSLAQMQWLLDTPGTIDIPSGSTVVDDVPIRIPSNHAALCLAVSGNYTCPYIILDGGCFGIYVDTTGVLNFTDSDKEPVFIYDKRVTDFHFRNRGRVTYNAPRFTRYGYGNCNTSIIEMNNPSTMYFGGTNVQSAPCMLVGYQKIYGGN